MQTFAKMAMMTPNETTHQQTVLMKQHISNISKQLSKQSNNITAAELTH